VVNRATATGRCRLDNGNAPQEPGLTEAEKADTQAFLKEILQILPFVGLRAFEFPKAVASPIARIITILIFLYFKPPLCAPLLGVAPDPFASDLATLDASPGAAV
jgi:hypothetical protein